MKFFNVAAIVLFFVFAIYCLVTGSFTSALFLAGMGVVCIINHMQQLKKDAMMREMQEQRKQWKQNRRKNKKR